MKSLGNFDTAALLAFASLAPTPLLAQTTMGSMVMEMSNGEVRKIDKDAQKITLKHGEIKSMDMPPMTMVFRVLDMSLFDKVKTGDKVKFSAEKRDGAIVVTAIEVAK